MTSQILPRPPLPSMLVATCVCLLGCAGGEATPTTGTTTEDSAGGDSNASASATTIPEDLEGTWAQYWAPNGQVDSPRYLLLPDGRFGWVAARGATQPGPRQMSGTWARTGDTLTLNVERTRGEDGSVAKPADPVRELQLGACPDNDEARALDAQYACISLDGQAYFRRPVDASEQADFFE